MASRDPRSTNLEGFLQLCGSLGAFLSDEGIIVQANPVWASWLDYEPEEVVGRPLWDFLHSDDREALRCCFSQEDDSGNHPTIHTRVQRRDGRFRWMSWTLTRMNGLVFALALDISEIMEPGNELRHRNEISHLALDAISIGLVHARDSKFVWANQVYLDMKQIRLEEIQGKPLSHYFARGMEFGDLRKRALEAFARGELFHEEILVDSPRGKVWEKLTGKSVDPGNPAAGTFWMVQDINEEKELRELHDKTSTFLKATMDSINDGFLLVDEDMTVHYQNHQFRQLFDMPPEVRDTRDHLVLLEYGARAHRDPREFEQLILGIYQTTTPSDDMLHLKNGKVIHSQSFPLAIEGGNRGRIWWFRDLTRELEKEKALKDQQQKIENIYKAAPVSIGLIVDGKIMEGNDTLFRTMGYTKEEMIGRDAMSTFGTGTEDNEGVRDAYARHAHETGIFSDATKWRTRQGTLIDVLVKMVPLDPEYPMKAAIFTGLDITDLKRANEKINRLNAELEEKVALRTRQLKAANKDLESFAYSVSHDLRAPLRHVDGFLKLLYQNIEDKNERVERFHDKTRSATLRMSEMIDDLLSLSRVGRTILHVMPVDLNRLFDSGIATLKDGLPADDTTTWVLHDLPVVLGDEGLLQLVTENLLSNAAKYSAREKQPRIEIGPWKENGQTGFYIRDNGVGFDMKYADKLFGVFQRLHSSEEFEGVGIGLANVKQIIQKHDGQIRAESTPGHGATFFVTLPELTLRPES